MYKVTFLNNEDFEKLPGKDMSSKVGVAYPEYGEAYVRKSGSNLVDIFSMAHELEHLKGDSLNEHYDAENKCYYKGFNDIFNSIANVASFIPGPWQAPAAIYSTGRQAVGAFSGGKDGSKQQPEISNSGFSDYMGTPPPAISQASGGMGAGNSMGAVGGNAVRGLSQLPQFQDIQNQRYGSQSGRSPLMNAFGGQ